MAVNIGRAAHCAAVKKMVETARRASRLPRIRAEIPHSGRDSYSCWMTRQMPNRVRGLGQADKGPTNDRPELTYYQKCEDLKRDIQEAAQEPRPGLYGSPYADQPTRRGLSSGPRLQ